MRNLIDTLKGYKKTIAALFTALMVFAGAVIISKESPITAAEWYTLAGGLGGALGVYQLANEPKY